MAIINLSKEVMDRGRQPESGWSPARLNAVNENKSSKGDSINHFFEFICTGGPDESNVNEGRYATTMFNSKALGQAKDGRGAIPAVINLFVTMVASLNNLTAAELESDHYDTEKLTGKSCWIKIEPVADLSGKLNQSIVNFAVDNELPF